MKKKDQQIFLQISPNYLTPGVTKGITMDILTNTFIVIQKGEISKWEYPSTKDVFALVKFSYYQLQLKCRKIISNTAIIKRKYLLSKFLISIWWNIGRLVLVDTIPENLKKTEIYDFFFFIHNFASNKMVDT